MRRSRGARRGSVGGRVGAGAQRRNRRSAHLWHRIDRCVLQRRTCGHRTKQGSYGSGRCERGWGKDFQAPDRCFREAGVTTAFIAVDKQPTCSDPTRVAVPPGPKVSPARLAVAILSDKTDNEALCLASHRRPRLRRGRVAGGHKADTRRTSVGEAEERVAQSPLFNPHSSPCPTTTSNGAHRLSRVHKNYAQGHL
jgi:hypothetical protein